MDAIEILGGLLGRKSSGSSAGGKILKDIIFGGSQRPTVPPSPRSQPSDHSQADRSAGPVDISREARELEDLLNVATRRSAPSSPAPKPHSPSMPAPNRQTVPQSKQPEYPYAEKPDPRFESTRTVPAPRTAPTPPPAQVPIPQDQNEQAIIMIRAMINAAKADGQVSRDEQDSILSQLGNPSQETIGFLRGEFARPLDVREFAWSVPLGMEQQVYTMSLIGMNLDSQAEARYLLELAHGLRIRAEVRRQIHQHYGAPDIDG